MNTFRFVLVTSLGLGLSSTGCLGNADPLVADIEPPHFKALGTGGGISPNGLSPNSFHSNLTKLSQAMSWKLVGPGGSQVSQEVLNTGLLSTPEGRETFTYAVQCALSTTVYGPGEVPNQGSVPYYGHSLLTTTGGWLDGNLSMGQRQDVFACLLAHLNPAPLPVHILLSGNSVRDKSDDVNEPDQDAFSFDEAVWGVTVDTSLAATLRVWPMRDLVTTCGRGVFDILQTRVCAFDLLDCGVDVRGDLPIACDETAGHFTCYGQPAIRSRLEPGSVSKMYGGCAP